MSEMFIPTSVWDQSHQFNYGIFELIDADMILGMMKDTFNQKVGLENQYIMNPLTYSMQFAFRNNYDRAKDAYKYRLSVSIEKVCFNIKPQTVRDSMRFQQYLEMHSYIRELQRFRPHIRI